MATPYIGEIRLVAYTFASVSWADCAGQLLPISQNQALFSLLGTSYGGDGRVTFALPDLRGRVPIGTGTGLGMTPRTVGEIGGVESVALLLSQIPAHIHAMNARKEAGDSNNAIGTILASSSQGAKNFSSQGPSPVPMAPDVLAPVGQGQPHDNMQPTLTLKYVIALQGVFPSRP